MANIVNSVQGNFDKFVESMYQYLKEPIKDFASMKPQLLDIFKTHRPIKVGDYQYGISKSLKGKSQLIIHEFNQRSMVREYFKTGNNNWNCCECSRIDASKNDGIADVLVLNGIIFVKLKHECVGREILFVQKVQKLYKEKKVEEADALQKSVLGSEDLNITVKTAAVKHGTRLSSENTRELDSEIASIIASAGEKYKDDDGMQPEHFSKSFEMMSTEEIFSKIIENLEEYTNEPKEVIMANKSKLLTVLKIHRPVKIVYCRYGLLQNLRKDRCLIIFEWGETKRVRQYSKRTDRPNLWTCCECYRLLQGQRTIVVPCIYLVNGIAFAPGDHHCEPRDYELVMQYQKFLEEGKITKARRMAQIVNFTYGECSLKNIVNVLDIKSTSLDRDNASTTIGEKENVGKNLTNLKRKILPVNNSLDQKSSAHKRSKLNESILKDTVVDENDSVLLDEKLPPVFNKSKTKNNQKHHVDDAVDSSTHSKSKPSTSITTTSIYHFEKPSTSKLAEICGKFNIRYRNKVVKLWDTIIFYQIDTVSMPSSNMQTHFFETDNFYQVLSIFFTGKSKQHEEIKTTIIDAFREKLVSSGELSITKFNKRYLDTVTDEHFDFISKYLSCRILIFDGENGIKKYGKWKSPTSTRLTLVVAFKEGYYSIVLSL